MTIGDAFGFLDPLYSSGVLLALRSGEMAADAIVEGLAKNDISEAQLASGGPRSIKASIVCDAWCANTTTALASATLCASIRRCEAL